MAKKKTRRRGRPSRLTSLSTQELQVELDRRQEAAGALEAARDDLLVQISDLDVEITKLDGRSPPRRRKRVTRKKRRAKKTTRRRAPAKKRTTKKRAKKVSKRKTIRRTRRGGKMTLADALHKVLKRKTLSVIEATAAVKKSGYRSKSANLRVMVNQQLLAKRKRFKKVARGQYTAR